MGAGGGRILNNPVAVVGFGLLMESSGGAVFVTREMGEAFAVKALLFPMRVALASRLTTDGGAPVVLSCVFPPAILAHRGIHANARVVVGGPAPSAVGAPEGGNKLPYVFAGPGK